MHESGCLACCPFGGCGMCRLGLPGMFVCVPVGLGRSGVGGRGELAEVVAQGRGGGALLRQGRLQIA
jgi:hypothetical protein